MIIGVCYMLTHISPTFIKVTVSKYKYVQCIKRDQLYSNNEDVTYTNDHKLKRKNINICFGVEIFYIILHLH